MSENPPRVVQVVGVVGFAVFVVVAVLFGRTSTVAIGILLLSLVVIYVILRRGERGATDDADET